MPPPVVTVVELKQKSVALSYQYSARIAVSREMRRAPSWRRIADQDRAICTSWPDAKQLSSQKVNLPTSNLARSRRTS